MIEIPIQCKVHLEKQQLEIIYLKNDKPIPFLVRRRICRALSLKLLGSAQRVSQVYAGA